MTQAKPCSTMYMPHAPSCAHRCCGPRLPENRHAHWQHSPEESSSRSSPSPSGEPGGLPSGLKSSPSSDSSAASSNRSFVDMLCARRRPPQRSSDYLVMPKLAAAALESSTANLMVHWSFHSQIGKGLSGQAIPSAKVCFDVGPCKRLPNGADICAILRPADADGRIGYRTGSSAAAAVSEDVAIRQISMWNEPLTERLWEILLFGQCWSRRF